MDGRNDVGDRVGGRVADGHEEGWGEIIVQSGNSGILAEGVGGGRVYDWTEARAGSPGLRHLDIPPVASDVDFGGVFAQAPRFSFNDLVTKEPPFLTSPKTWSRKELVRIETRPTVSTSEP